MGVWRPVSAMIAQDRTVPACVVSVHRAPGSRRGRPFGPCPRVGGSGTLTTFRPAEVDHARAGAHRWRPRVHGMRRRAAAGVVMPVRDVVEIRLTRVKAHLVMEPELSLIDCGYAGSANRIVRAIAAQGRSPGDLRRVVALTDTRITRGAHVSWRSKDRDPDPPRRRRAHRDRPAGRGPAPVKSRLFAAMTPELRRSRPSSMATSCRSSAGWRSSTRPATRPAASACTARATASCSWAMRSSTRRQGLVRQRSLQRRPRPGQAGRETPRDPGRRGARVQPLPALAGRSGGDPGEPGATGGRLTDQRGGPRRGDPRIQLVQESASGSTRARTPHPAVVQDPGLALS